jgi:hypothetical protein
MRAIYLLEQQLLVPEEGRNQQPSCTEVLEFKTISKFRKKTFLLATYIFFFLILDCEAIGTAATPGLLCQPLVIVKMIVEK